MILNNNEHQLRRLFLWFEDMQFLKINTNNKKQLGI